MKKIIRIGTTPTYTGKRHMSIYCKITLEQRPDKPGLTLSISGVEGPLPSGNCLGSCGQIHMSLDPATVTPAPGWTTALITRLLVVWDRYHLNDMKPNCEHQTGEQWNTSRKLSLIGFTWGGHYHQQRHRVESGTSSADEYTEFQAVTPRVLAATMLDAPRHTTPETDALSADGWIKLDPKKQEQKTAGWITPTEHPDGLLCKPCPICGYKYGTAWQFEPIPAEVIDFLESLPETDKQPAWV